MPYNKSHINDSVLSVIPALWVQPVSSLPGILVTSQCGPRSLVGELTDVCYSLEGMGLAIQNSTDLKHRVFVYSFMERTSLSRPRLLEFSLMARNVETLAYLKKSLLCCGA